MITHTAVAGDESESQQAEAVPQRTLNTIHGEPQGRGPELGWSREGIENS